MTAAPTRRFPASHRRGRFPAARGLYDPALEHDSCGVGFVAHIRGKRSHSIVRDADRILRRMTHRGACGCEANTGDGAGMLTALPHVFLARVAGEAGVSLPDPGRYAAGNVFLPRESRQYHRAKDTLEARVTEYGLTVLGWREVPHDADAADVGPSARACQPRIEQLFVGASDDYDEAAFDRALFLARKSASRIVRQESRMPEALLFYVCSLNARTIVYKGMLTPAQVVPFYPDLAAGDYMTHLAMVHSRFSTNTFPSWDRAQPLRNIAHNGEINTLRGNRNWMAARQGQLVSGRFDGKLADAFPICEPHLSDSGNFDNCLELLLRSGRPLQEAVMLMIPEAWQNHDLMPENKRAFYEYHSALMEPWDGPASVSFTDGHVIGAVLDRNGLRPSRYYVTHDDRVVMASEVGVLDIAPEKVKEKGRLKPGRMFLVNFDEGRIVPDEELKRIAADRRPYGDWLREQRLDLVDLPQSRGPAGPRLCGQALLKSLRGFGYSEETLRFMLLPLIRAKKDPIGSMGDDAALACLSAQPRLVPDYFKQLFAQVTNPAIDSIREEIVMSLECFVGPEGNLLNTTPEQCRRLRLPHPVLTDDELASLKALAETSHEGWTARVADFTFAKQTDPARAAAALAETLDALCREADAAIEAGQALLILSDRAAGPGRVAVPALLAAGAVHQHLIRTQSRTKLGLILESGETREVHHFCTLVGYGADAVNPYLAFAAIRHARDAGTLSPHAKTGEPWTDQEIVKAYRKGVGKGMLKVFAKMGISTLQSYKGAQIFEALGLGAEVIDRCFTGTPSRIKGVGFDRLARDAMERHDLGYAPSPGGGDGDAASDLPNPGTYAWRAEGEKHAWNPLTIAAVQSAARTNDPDAYRQFSEMVNRQVARDCNLRGLVRFRTEECDAIDPEWVEPASEIVKRFCTGAMSFGSISAEAHETLAVAMNRLGGKSNTGEGGEKPERFSPLPNGDTKRSAIKQVASGRFGVTSWYLTNADEIQIKISQGAKPGEGGELPGHKVDDVIAKVRHSTKGVGLISPPPHHDIYSIEDLSQLIFDLKNANPDARISVKLVSEVGVGTIAAGVAKGHADNILISGSSGGTGASPLTSIKHAGLPWELGIAETHQTLVMNGLRSRVRLQTDGQLKTGRDVAVACLLGAEEFGFSTAPLITLGCIMMRKCHLNTCPVGIATQDPALRKMFRGQPEHVVNYLFAVAEECREVLASLGLRSIDEAVGRADLLAPDLPAGHPKAGLLDLSPILRRVGSSDPAENHQTIAQDHGLKLVKDNRLIAEAAPALRDGTPVEMEYEIENVDRAFGTMLSHEVSKARGADGLPDGTITIRCTGSAGQSLGAWLAKGITIEVTGDANDYVGKGLSGGRIIVRPPENPGFQPAENMILGNVALYGATGGELFARGVAAERFCVRNSGANAVVEGCGDHGCEYMTGGRAVILGETGRNFAAGMSGGVAFVHDPADTLLAKTNLATVELEPVDGDDVDALRTLIERHRDLTGSERAARLLRDWKTELPKFRRVMPVDYRRALAERAGESPEAGMSAAAAGETVTPVVAA